MKTGIYYRVKRGEKWHSLDLTEMTTDEVNEFLWKMTEEQLMRTIRVLIKQMSLVEVVEEDDDEE